MASGVSDAGIKSEQQSVDGGETSSSSSGSQGQQNKQPEVLSLITDVAMEHGSDENPPAGGVVSWCPPTTNWNPWIGGNIDEGNAYF